MSTQDLNLTERTDISPKCPHCGGVLNEVHFRAQGLGFISARTTVFFCPHCQKVLGFGQTAMV